MNYELCKKLKEAGFPNAKDINGEDKSFVWVKYNPEDDFIPVDSKIFYEFWQQTYSIKGNIDIFPTLSELIEACGDKFGTLYHNVHKEEGELEWSVATYSPDCVGHGDTPEEAVANLWLKLNK